MLGYSGISTLAQSDDGVLRVGAASAISAQCATASGINRIRNSSQSASVALTTNAIAASRLVAASSISAQSNIGLIINRIRQSDSQIDTSSNVLASAITIIRAYPDLVSAALSMSSAANSIRNVSPFVEIDAIFIANARLKWELEADTPETWNGVADTAETWSAVADTSETWTDIAETAEIWTDVPDASETWTEVA